MKFNIVYPNEMVEPKGLHIPTQEDVQQAVKLAQIVANYVKIPDTEDFEFTIMVSDEINLSKEHRFVSCANTGEGVTLFPLPDWNMENVFDSILFAIFEA